MKKSKGYIKTIAGLIVLWHECCMCFYGMQEMLSLRKIIWVFIRLYRAWRCWWCLILAACRVWSLHWMLFWNSNHYYLWNEKAWEWTITCEVGMIQGQILEDMSFASVDVPNSILQLTFHQYWIKWNNHPQHLTYNITINMSECDLPWLTLLTLIWFLFHSNSWAFSLAFSFT